MPRVLKIIYLGAAALAVVAFGLGFFDYVIAGEADAHFGSDVFLPVVIFIIIIALYTRRKKEMELRRRGGRKKDKPLGEKI